MNIKITRYQAATGIAIFFHSIGLAGILFYPSPFFINATPFNLLLSLALLLWTDDERNYWLLLFSLIAFVTGFVAEVIGVNTKLLFGDYQYGQVLGYKWMNVPLIIAINWFIIIYCCGISIHTLMKKVVDKVALQNNESSKAIKALSVIIDGASLAVAFDWLMEPVAVKLGFWNWNGNNIPVYNYVCWFAVSLFLLSWFHFLPFSKKNKFAVNLLLIQALFFLILRTFLD